MNETLSINGRQILSQNPFKKPRGSQFLLSDKYNSEDPSNKQEHKHKLFEGFSDLCSQSLLKDLGLDKSKSENHSLDANEGNTLTFVANEEDQQTGIKQFDKNSHNTSYLPHDYSNFPINYDSDVENSRFFDRMPLSRYDQCQSPRQPIIPRHDCTRRQSHTQTLINNCNPSFQRSYVNTPFEGMELMGYANGLTHEIPIGSQQFEFPRMTFGNAAHRHDVPIRQMNYVIPRRRFCANYDTCNCDNCFGGHISNPCTLEVSRSNSLMYTTQSPFFPPRHQANHRCYSNCDMRGRHAGAAINFDDRHCLYRSFNNDFCTANNSVSK